MQTIENTEPMGPMYRLTKTMLDGMLEVSVLKADAEYKEAASIIVRKDESLEYYVGHEVWSKYHKKPESKSCTRSDINCRCNKRSVK